MDNKSLLFTKRRGANEYKVYSMGCNTLNFTWTDTSELQRQADWRYKCFYVIVMFDKLISHQFIIIHLQFERING